MTAPDPGFAVVVVPTHNERVNLPIVVSRPLGAAGPDLRIPVVDDGSPDRTGDVADDLARASEGRLRVLHRGTKDGLGRAYRAGMSHAFTQGPGAAALPWQLRRTGGWPAPRSGIGDAITARLTVGR